MVAGFIRANSKQVKAYKAFCSVRYFVSSEAVRLVATSVYL